jgi:hypothetical protein
VDPERSGPVRDRLTGLRPRPAAFVAAAATAIILFTFGGLDMLSIRGIMRCDASEIFAAGALAATAGPRGALLDTPDTTRQAQARDDADRAIVALLAALPEAVDAVVGGVHGDSMIVLAVRSVPGRPATLDTLPPIGAHLPVPMAVQTAWAAGRPYIEPIDGVGGSDDGFLAYAPVRSSDGHVAGFVRVTADAGRYTRREADLRETVLLGVGITIALAVANRTGMFVAKLDEEVLDNLAPDQLEAIADRAWRRRKRQAAELGDEARPLADYMLRIRCTDVDAAKTGCEVQFGGLFTRWKYLGKTKEPDGTKVIEYSVQPIESVTPGVIKEILRAVPGQIVVAVELRQ